MDNTQRSLIIAAMVTLVVILGLMFYLNTQKKYGGNSGIVIEQGGENITKEEQENVTTQEEKIILEEINLTSELTIDYLNREKLYDNSQLVLYGKLTEIKNAEYIKGIKYPFTNIIFEVTEVVKGKLPLEQNMDLSSENKKINLKVPGGDVTINDYIKATIEKNPEEIAKKGYDKLTEAEKANKYIRINYEYTKEYLKDNWYVLILTDIGNETYIVPTYTCMLETTSELKNITKDTIIKLSENK